MIYVRRDPGLIPEKVLRLAERTQAELEALPEAERAAFIRKKSCVWRGFAKYLSKMSYGKCWYSESPPHNSFFDVDHFRPKNEARRDVNIVDDGYPWLAFSWENFRLVAGRANRRSIDEETLQVVGKGSWFPLVPGTAQANWGDRSIEDERPLLLDPTVRTDVDLIDVNVMGYMCCGRFCVGTAQRRVERSIELYGLNLPGLISARAKVMRAVRETWETLLQTVAVAQENEAIADGLPIEGPRGQLWQATLPDSPFSKAARAQLRMLGALELCAAPEDLPNIA